MFNIIDNSSDSNRFQEGLFTAFYTMEKFGMKLESIFKIFRNLDENNILGDKDFMNLRENYIKFRDQFKSIEDNIKNI